MSDTLTTRDGIELYHRHWPQENPRATLLIVHGFGEHSGRWQHVAETFRDHGYEVHAYDLRGHGRSEGEHIDVLSFDEYIGDLAELVAAVKDASRPLFVYGHSMGGLISTLYAQSTHEQPDAYVLSAPALEATVGPILRLAAKLLPKIFPRLLLASPVKGEQLSRDPRVGEAYFKDPLVKTQATTRHGAAALGVMDLAKKRVSEIAVPCLVIHGSDDELVPVTATQVFEGCPGATRRVYEGLRHEMHNEPEQDAVLRDVLGWLEQRLS